MVRSVEFDECARRVAQITDLGEAHRRVKSELTRLVGGDEYLLPDVVEECEYPLKQFATDPQTLMRGVHQDVLQVGDPLAR